MISPMPSKLKAVVIDLYGTLIDSIMKPSYRAVHKAMAETLSIPYDRYGHMMGLTHYSRSVGHFDSWEANIEHICHELGVQPGVNAIRLVARMRNDYARKLMMKPKAGALEALQHVKEQGFKTGLISDCTPDEPEIWRDTPLAPWFNAAVFSSDVGLKKPDPQIYELAVRRLGVQASQCIYIGDGQSDELQGAAQIGMHAVLIQNDAIRAKALSDAWEQWEGDVVSSFNEVLTLIIKYSH
jgi:putative hydrolase of the HAD superfamily